MYGRIFYLNPSGATLMVTVCFTEEQYEAEKEAGCRWVESEHGAVSIRGEVIEREEGGRAA